MSKMESIPVGAVYGGFGGAVFGCVCWLFPMSWIANDWLTAIVVAILAVLLFAFSTRFCLRHPQHYRRAALWMLAGLALINLVVVNLRWNDWISHYRQSAYYRATNDLPLQSVNLLIIGMFAGLFVLLAVVLRRPRPIETKYAGNDQAGANSDEA